MYRISDVYDANNAIAYEGVVNNIDVESDAVDEKN